MASQSAAAGSSRKRKLQDEQDDQQICPFLDTIQRSVLDFDLEPACSVSLVKGPHIYACLVCGKYFRGRGSSTPAYTHAVEESHFVFCHLSKGTFHCLPDDYEIQDPSLQDIRDALHPTFTKAEIAKLDSNTELARDLFGRMYLPGFVGLNNHHKTDGINAVVQALAHVRPLRDFFLGKHHDDHLSDASQQQKHRSSYDVTRCFGELVRKLWSDRRFKSHVDPHMLVNAIAAASNKKYGAAGRQVEAGEFMAWFLHQLHLGTGGSMKKKRKKSTSIIEQTFQGQVRVTTRQAKRQTFKRTNSDEQDDRAGSDAEDDNEDAEMKEASQKEEEEDEIRIEETTVDSHFLQLTLDISEKPLFRDEDGGLVIPQEPLVTVLKKFDGVTFTDALSRSGVAQKRKYALQKLPDYLILHLNRFKTNEYSREKNPTIVAFPVKNLDLSDYVQPEGGHRPTPPTEDQVRQMSIKQLKETLRQYGRGHIAENAIEKKDLLETTIDLVTQSLPDLVADKYDLVANITHDSPADVGREGQHDPLQDGSYKCHVQHRGGAKQWYEIQDLHVQEIMPQQISVSESYLLIFERKSAQPSL